MKSESVKKVRNQRRVRTSNDAFARLHRLSSSPLFSPFPHVKIRLENETFRYEKGVGSKLDGSASTTSIDKNGTAVPFSFSIFLVQIRSAERPRTPTNTSTLKNSAA